MAYGKLVINPFGTLGSTGIKKELGKCQRGMGIFVNYLFSPLTNHNLFWFSLCKTTLLLLCFETLEQTPFPFTQVQTFHPFFT